MRTGRLGFPALLMTLAAAHTTASADSGPSANSASYTVTPILIEARPPECLDGFAHVTFARRLNERAQIAGIATCFIATDNPAAPYLGTTYAFTWAPSIGATLLPAVSAAASSTFGRAINESGTVVGWELSNDGYRGLVWPASGGAAYVADSVPCVSGGFVFTRPEGINDQGSIVAVHRGLTAGCETRWLLKLANGQEALGPHGGSPRDINNRNVVVGTADYNRVVRWSPTGGEVVLATPVPGETSPLAWAINDFNEAVGYTYIFDPESGCAAATEAKFWAANGTERTLPGLPGAPHAVAFGINANSHVVGYVQFETPCGNPDPAQSRAVLWRGGNLKDLNALVPRQFASEVQLYYATAINDQGQILARGIRPSEPKQPCPLAEIVNGEVVSYDPTTTCQNEYAYLLTPLRR